jgi:hypothetical protein
MTKSRSVRGLKQNRGELFVQNKVITISFTLPFSLLRSTGRLLQVLIEFFVLSLKNCEEGITVISVVADYYIL